MKRLWACFACLWALSAQSAGAPPLRRFALLIGVNDGGPGRKLLRYAATDAYAFGRVLDELGGLAAADRLLLIDGESTDVLASLSELQTRVAQVRDAGGRTEVVIYYSGHSDDQGLLLHGRRLGYGDFRARLDAIPADVRIVILDSCASGAFARRKGGIPHPAFLIDDAVRVSGHAILTSSSANEASQESDRIGGSFFTHNLVSGLRGAADVTRDGRVTLNEAYAFAFHETLARTENTQAGAQHPTYDIELAGTGDVVMTDLRSTSAGLVLDEKLEGKLSVRDAQGVLVVELSKRGGQATELGLAPGRYTVLWEIPRASAVAEVVLSKSHRIALAEKDFVPTDREATLVRGEALLEVPQGTQEFVPGAQTGLPAPKANTVYLELGGVGLLAAVHYDRRFGERLAIQAGVGVLPLLGSLLVTLPISVSVLLGPRESHHHLELGAGVVPFVGFYDSRSHSEVEFHLDWPSGLLGYRYQRRDGGFFFRAGLTPFLVDFNEVRPWAGLSAGYTL